MRNRKLAAVGLALLATAGTLALFDAWWNAPQAPHDAPAGSDVRFAGTLTDAGALRHSPAWAKIAHLLDNHTYLLEGGDATVVVLVTLPEPAQGDAVVEGRVVARVVLESGSPLVLVRGHA